MTADTKAQGATFAKIVIASDGGQVLFFKDNGEDGNSELVQMTCVDGITARLGMGFADDDAGDAARDRAFETAGVPLADVVRKTVLGMLEGNNHGV